MANEENNFENDEIAGVLNALKRVDAPVDFDFRVRSRIAAGRAAVRPTWLPALGKATAMMILVAAVAGYFGFLSYRSPAVEQASVISILPRNDEALVPRDEIRNDRAVIPPSEEHTSEPVAVRPPDAVALRGPEIAGKRPITRTVSSTRGGGSRVDASKITNVITAPDRTQPLSAKDVLSGLGIDANNSGSSWTIGEVTKNSRAERSGLKTGDVIESVKNKTVRVRRGGKVIQIELKP